MKALTYFVQGLHVILGITPPPPEKTTKYALLWLGTLLASATIVAVFGYLIIGLVFPSHQ